MPIDDDKQSRGEEVVASSEEEDTIEFSVGLATSIGLLEAILWHHLSTYLLHPSQEDNEEQGFMFTAGLWWAKLPLDFFEGLFPFCSKQELIRGLRSLQKQGWIVSKGIVPGNSYATRWYSIHPDVLRTIETERGSESIPIRPAQNAPGKIYLLAGESYHKIGKARNVNKRLRRISVKMPFETQLVHSIRTNDIHQCETYWHRRFAEKRCSGEWFKLTENDVAEFCSRSEMTF